MAYYCYMVRCANGSFYTGWTTDPQRRVNEHNAGRGARYTRMRGQGELVYFEEVEDHSTALKREAQIESYTHARKKWLANSIELPEDFKGLREIRINPTSKERNSQTIISPGRVNLLGEHVDYNDGPVLPVAIDLTMTLTFSPLNADLIELHAIDLGKTIAFEFSNLEDKVDINGGPLPHFALYPASVAWACRQAGLSIRGMRAAYTSNIPMGSGLSSSAAVEVAFMQAFKALGDWDTDRMTLAKLAQKGENEYVGVHSGIVDQFACMFGMENQALYLDTRSLDWEPVPCRKMSPSSSPIHRSRENCPVPAITTARRPADKRSPFLSDSCLGSHL